MSAILGLDFGTVRIGLAICEGSGLPAVPLTTLERHGFAHDLDAIVRIAKERAADTIVVGYPVRLDGARGPAADRVDRFIEELRSRFEGTVARQDERLTTAAAHKKLRDLDVSGSKRRKHVDELAAVEILNVYLAIAQRK